jgi:hypothetical protein
MYQCFFVNFTRCLRFTSILLILGLAITARVQAVQIGNNATLPTGNLACNATTGTFGTLTCGQFATTAHDPALTPTADGVTGLKFWLTGNLLDNESANTSPTTVLAFTSSGAVSGGGEPAGILIPFTYDFTLSTSNAGTLASYTLLFDIKQGTTSIFSSAPTFSGALSGNSASPNGGNQFATVNPITSGQTYTVSAQLTVQWNTGNGASGLTIGVPQNSFDVNSTTFSGAVPEPASFGLLSIGLFGGAAILRRRRNQS